MLCHRVAFYRHGRTSQVLLHIHTYRPTRRPGSPSRPVSTSGFLQLAQVHAAHALQHKTSHHIIAGAPVRPCATNSTPRCERRLHVSGAAHRK